MPSVVKEIDSVEEKVKNCEKKLDKLERRLRLANITDEERRKLKEDEKQLQNTLKGHHFKHPKITVFCHRQKVKAMVQVG
ncbi:uncharacterized protein LOC141903316 isoform X2 [Tubulanus polymorphus]|uniref:uncharacterized protein LOC141903316 isoform X2 n=1 Tax=Tubulanus polymorphus TaxID=672921 RepID=UPI003DA24918